MLKSMLNTIKREWDLMIKEKMIFILLIIMPLLVNILLGFEFSNGQIQHVPMAIIDQDNSSLSRMIVQQFVENETFAVKYFLDNSIEMKKLFDCSKVRVGMVIPKDFSKNVMALQSPTILMLYDGSHMSIASATKSKASEILLTLKTGMLIKLLQGKLNLHRNMAQKMALAISFSNRTLYNPTKNFKNFLNPGFGTAIVQSALALLTATAVRNNEIDNKKRKKTGYILGKISFYGALGFLSLMLNILIQNKIFHIPLRGKLTDVALLSFFFAVSVSSFGIMLSTWVRNEMIATVINAVIFVPSTIMAGYTWPVISMPKPYQIGAAFLPFYHYADNLRDLFLKKISIDYMIHDIVWFTAFIFFTSFVAVIGIFRLRVIRLEKSTVITEEGEQLAFCEHTDKRNEIHL